MTLSAPIHVLRSEAKTLKREQGITLNEAQNRIARREGFNAWSHLVTQQKDFLPDSLQQLKRYLHQGDLVLLGARPRLGKMRVAASLVAATASGTSPKSFFFTLAERAVTVRSKIEPLLPHPYSAHQVVEIDSSDYICADAIIEKLSNETVKGSLIVIDYLQALDEKRINPALQEQIEALRAFALEARCTILFIAQLNRSVDERPEQPPTESDIRLPNPLDLGLFNKILFLYQSQKDAMPGKTQVTVRLQRPKEHEFTVNYGEIGLG